MESRGKMYVMLKEKLEKVSGEFKFMCLIWLIFVRWYKIFLFDIDLRGILENYGVLWFNKDELWFNNR